MGAQISSFKEVYTNSFPPAATYTPEQYPDLTGKVFLVTGGLSGIGLDVSVELLKKNAKVYSMSRNQQVGEKAIEQIKKDLPNAQVFHITLDLGDLASIKNSAAEFLSKETSLHTVIHNAGTYNYSGKKTIDGYEQTLGINCIGPHLLQKYLNDILIRTAVTAPRGSVRIVWVSSQAHSFVPKDARINWNDINFDNARKPYIRALQGMPMYAQSKAINVYEAILWNKKHKDSGILSVSLHPGGLKTNIYWGLPDILRLTVNLLCYDTIYGAYTELYAALSPDLTLENEGLYIYPWGRPGEARPDIVQAANGEEGDRLWKWLDQQVAPFF